MNEYLACYQKLLFSEHEGTSQTNADTQRKCMALMHNSSLKSGDEKSTCYLLEQNLNKYQDTIEKDPSNNNRVKKILADRNIRTPVDLKSGLANIDLKSMLTPFPCTKDELKCEKSEKISQGDFQNFLTSFTKPKTAKPTRILAQTSNPKLNRYKSEELNSPNTENARFPRNNSTGKPEFGFRTALEEYHMRGAKKKAANGAAPTSYSDSGKGANKKQLGLGFYSNVPSKFVSPVPKKAVEESPKETEWPADVDERLKGIDPKMIELIRNEIMNSGPQIQWADIAGLEFAKTAIQEAVVWPMLRPDIFTGLRRPPKGILLFGPPGTGKTLIGKCVAAQSRSTFFSISASSLTSKWVGDGEKMVRALFAVARCHQPAVVFIDEIDSLLMQRSETEHESSRRIKTEFLVQLDGATTESEERILVIGATNRPQELDEAARRRFVKRLYIPLPGVEARLQLVSRLIAAERHELNEANLGEVARLSDGYSGADIKNLCSEASLGPIRSINLSQIENIKADEVRALTMDDFLKAFTRVRTSVAAKDLEQYVVWDNTYGSGL